MSGPNKEERNVFNKVMNKLMYWLHTVYHQIFKLEITEI